MIYLNKDSIWCSSNNEDMCLFCKNYTNVVYNKCIVNYNVIYKVSMCREFEIKAKDKKDDNK